jgi:hypothetical protein
MRPGTEAPRLKIEIAAPGFFAVPLKKVEIETVRETGRTYFIYRGAIVAVARKGGEHDDADSVPGRLRGRLR